MRSKSLELMSAAVVVTLLGLSPIALQDLAAAENDPAVQQADPMQFAKGAKTWADVCARCHNMRDARSLRDDQWRAAVAHMRVRAHLTKTEADNVLAFLQQSN
ncbi:MAG: cytochrome c [Burkholderiales bacterium]|nr:cytochrome c [Burkholderiales bacterium]